MTRVEVARCHVGEGDWLVLDRWGMSFVQVWRSEQDGAYRVATLCGADRDPLLSEFPGKFLRLLNAALLASAPWGFWCWTDRGPMFMGRTSPEYLGQVRREARCLSDAARALKVERSGVLAACERLAAEHERKAGDRG